MEVSTRIIAVGIRIAAIAGVVVVLTLIINLSWFDEELHPELARLSIRRRRPMESQRTQDEEDVHRIVAVHRGKSRPRRPKMVHITEEHARRAR